MYHKAQAFERHNGRLPSLDLFLVDLSTTKEAARRQPSFGKRPALQETNQQQPSDRGCVCASVSASASASVPPADRPAAPAQAASNGEESTAAVNAVRGLVAEMKRGFDERQDKLAADVAAIGQVARASHDALLALTQRMQEMSEAITGTEAGCGAGHAPSTPTSHQGTQNQAGVPGACCIVGGVATVLRDGLPRSVSSTSYSV